MEKAVDLKQVNLKQVKEAIKQLRDRGDRVSRRSVQAMVGGSMTTVHRLLDQALEAEREEASVQTTSISEGLVGAILLEITSQVKAATDDLELRLSALSAREQEILSDLEGSEGRVASLEQEVATLQAQLASERQAAEKAAAVALEQQGGLREQIEKLETENSNLIRAGETARTESAKAQLQVERADLAAKKAEDRVQELESNLGQLTGAVKEAEKRAAVAERHAQDLTERVADLVAQAASNAEMLQQGSSTAEQLRQDLAKALKAAADADKRAALAEQQSESRVRELEGRVADLEKAKAEAEKGAAAADQLRVELTAALKAGAESDKRAALAEQRLSMTAEPV